MKNGFLASLQQYKSLMGWFFVGLLMIVWQHIHAARLTKEVRTLRSEADRLVVQNARFSKEIHQWASNSNLDWLARSQLKMTPLESKHVRSIASS